MNRRGAENAEGEEEWGMSASKSWRDFQVETPLLDALRLCANQPHAAFYTPGHKRGVGIAPSLAELLGTAVFRADLTELAELDALFAPDGVIRSAQELAAAAFGAEQTWFLVNGSTSGIIAAILATCGTGDKIILPRNVHSSAIAALILSGAIPIFVLPEYDPILDIAHSITPAAVADALKQHPDAKAVMMVYPTYYGVCGDVGAIARLAHQYNIPLLVDEAHGSHFAFHPELPTSALSAGADLTVQSIHKTLAGMTQASMLHVQGNRIDRNRLSKALQLVQSTSPSYILLASLDAARQQMALHGEALMTKTLQLADAARQQIQQIRRLSVLSSVKIPIFSTLDRTRLTVTVSGLGLTGFEVDDIFYQYLGVTAEFASLQHLTFIISLGNTEADIEQLVQAFTTLTTEYRRPPYPPAVVPLCTSTPLLSPREAFFAPTEILPIEQAKSRICAELICPYPPGIPVLLPGEVITKSALDYLQQIQTMGGVISGCADATLKTLKVLTL
jgi:arginine decarboxylase